MTRKILDVTPGALSEYYDWLKESEVGDVLIYWLGNLQSDRQIVIDPADVLRASDRLRVNQLNFIADRVLSDEKAGHVHLTQKKLGDGLYEYRATRRRQHAIDHITSEPPNDELIIA